MNERVCEILKLDDMILQVSTQPRGIVIIGIVPVLCKIDTMIEFAGTWLVLLTKSSDSRFAYNVYPAQCSNYAGRHTGHYSNYKPLR